MLAKNSLFNHNQRLQAKTRKELTSNGQTLTIMLPNFIIAGTTRSGTTSLYHYLMQHPEIDFPKLKEPRYFSSLNLELPQNGPGDFSVDKKLILSFEEYKQLYSNIKNTYVGDASSEYLYHYDISAANIKEKLGDIPIIIILRNPVERAFSAYNNLVRDCREDQTFENALDLEDERIQNNWDMMWHYKNVGLYYEQVKTYTQIFSRVKILIFEDFVQDANSKMKELFDFLGIKSDVKIDVRTRYSHSGKARNKLIQRLSSRKNPFINNLRVLALKCIPRKYLEWLGEKALVNETIMPDTRKMLYNYFQNDIKKLERLINKDLSHWK